jgi:glucosamine-6-phosphate isomerase
MKIFIADDYVAMSKQAADDVAEMMKARKQSLICTASGDSPAGLYKEIVERTNTKQLNVSDWFFVGLDEWIPMNGNDEGSCRYHLNHQLFDPLRVASDKICFFDGRANDLEAECDKTENFIRQHGGIDVAILGVGMNGHVGMNEPGTSIKTRSHIAELAATTQQVGQKYFKKEQKLTKGITLGLTTLMEAKNIILIVSGKHKAAITKKIVEDEISEDLPATLLRNHSSLRIYLDKEAASELTTSKNYE